MFVTPNWKLYSERNYSGAELLRPSSYSPMVIRTKLALNVLETKVWKKCESSTPRCWVSHQIRRSHKLSGEYRFLKETGKSPAERFDNTLCLGFVSPTRRYSINVINELDLFCSVKIHFVLACAKDKSSQLFLRLMMYCSTFLTARSSMFESTWFLLYFRQIERFSIN